MLSHGNSKKLIFIDHACLSETCSSQDYNNKWYVILNESLDIPFSNNVQKQPIVVSFPVSTGSGNP